MKPLLPKLPETRRTATTKGRTPARQDKTAVPESGNYNIMVRLGLI